MFCVMKHDGGERCGRQAKKGYEYCQRCMDILDNIEFGKPESDDIDNETSKPDDWEAQE